MTDYARHDLPADIAVFAGEFADQPSVFAYLWEVAPGLDLGQVDVIQTRHAARLRAHFDGETAARLAALGGTLVVVRPGAYEGLDCPVPDGAPLRALGMFRGTVPHLRVVT
ncbi:hypothetical protein [Gymnodinialimonas ceratoperidinii]|uniref:Uncharacterized protein n=1 Tax=Gymnodinialimonas ceratoperidinii TaxID=2856823 RepID=A0A8F6TX35_9RHOB|nr:hypothetical protein [Gymnodinialimonas ceratoperidinii]QXT39524.1 hypothetical protein KYE46_16625 [Gymnodinialimonas ceratoperidinii]